MHSTEVLCILQLCEGRYSEIIHKALEPLSYLGEVEVLELYFSSENNLTSVALIGQVAPLQKAIILIAQRARDMFNIQNYKGSKQLQGVVPSIAWHPLPKNDAEFDISDLSKFSKVLEEESGIPVVIHKSYPQIVDNFFPTEAEQNSHPTAGFIHLFHHYQDLSSSDLGVCKLLPALSQAIEKANASIKQHISWRTFFQNTSQLSSISSLFLSFDLIANRTQNNNNSLTTNPEWINTKSELFNLIRECEASEERWSQVQQKQAEYLPRHLEEEALAFQVRNILLRRKFYEAGATLFHYMDTVEKSISKEIFTAVFQEMETLLSDINDRPFVEYIQKQIREKKALLGLEATIKPNDFNCDVQT